MTPEIGFWTGVAFALPVYWFLDHVLIPWLVDVPWRTYRARFRVR